MKKLTIILFLLVGTAGAADNSATMGSYAEDFPSLRIWRSGNAYDDLGDFVSGNGFWGRNAARVSGGVANNQISGADTAMFFDSLKIHASGASRTIITEAYTDFMFYVECGNSNTENYTGKDAVGWLNAFPHNYRTSSDSLGLTWNDQFFQMADDSDSVNYALRWTSCAEGADVGRKWANADYSAYQIRQSQFGIYSGADDENWPGTDAYYMNYTDSMNYALMKSTAYRRLKDSSYYFLNLDTAVDGFTYDNSQPESFRSPNYIHDPGSEIYYYTFGGNTGGQVWSTGAADIDWIGYDEPMVKYGASYSVLQTAWHASFNVMLDTMKDMGIATSANFVNGSPTDVDGYAARQGEVVTVLFFELRAGDLLTKRYLDITATQGPNAELSRVDSAILYGIPHCNEFRSLGSHADDTGNSYSAHTYLCAHLTYQDTALSYFCFQNWKNGSSADGDSMYLANWGLFKQDFGNVLNTRQLYTTGTTVDGDPVNVFWREYENAFVYWFPPYNLTDDSAYTNYVEIDCGEPVYELGRSNPGHVDSTFRSDGNIRISPWRGVVAWKADTDGPPSITAISPDETYKDSTDDVTATIEDAYGVNHIWTWIHHPDSTPGVHDTISVFDSAYSTGDTAVTWNPSHEYTWPDSGNYWIVFVAVDDSGNTVAESLLILADVDHDYPIIANIQPTYGYTDSTDDISADITDPGGGTQYIYCWIIDPENDSNHVDGDTLSPVDVDTTMTYSYTWNDSGNHYIVWKAIDEGPAETIESLLVTISVQGVAEDSIRFDVSTGMIDVSCSGPPSSDTNVNQGSIIYLYNSEFYYHTFVGDYSIDDSLNEDWTIDSFWLVWNSEGVNPNYQGDDSTFMYLVMLDDNRDWIEIEATWLNWNSLNTWTNPGGDVLGCISDTTVVKSSTHPSGTIDTITIHRDTEYGEMWLDSCKYATGNFGFMILNKAAPGTAIGDELVYMRSTEHANASYRPWMKAFPHSSPLADLGVFILKGLTTYGTTYRR